MPASWAPRMRPRSITACGSSKRKSRANSSSPMIRGLSVAVLASALLGCAPSPPEPFRDCADCPEMVRIPEGDALLGAAPQDANRRPDELPARTFKMKAFAISKFEITRDQYDAFARATRRPATGPCLTDRAQRGNWVMDAGTSYLDPGFR